MNRTLPGSLAALGAVLVVGGAALFWFDQPWPGRPAAYGWSSYEPLRPGMHMPGAYVDSYSPILGGAVFWTGRDLLAVGLVVLGLLVLTGVGGWLLGRSGGAGAAAE